jgi:hypothetical protein
MKEGEFDMILRIKINYRVDYKIGELNGINKYKHLDGSMEEW